MNLKTRLLLTAALLVLTIPLIAGFAVATIYNTDGASHDPAQASGWALPSGYYCIATPSGWTPSATLPDAVQRDDITAPSSAPRNSACTITDTNTKNAVKYSNYPTNTTLRTRDECLRKGYNWSYLGYCVPNNWTTTSLDSRTPKTYYQDHNGCVRCHNTTYMTAAGHPDAAKESYLFGGHRNMSRATDGLTWGMPGVISGHGFAGDAEEADLCTDGTACTVGSFLHLWSQEDYPRMATDWATGMVTLSYCATGAPGGSFSHDSFGNDVTSQGNGPDTTACPTCETPILGDAGWGYPLNYPDQTTCESAGKCSTVPTYPNHNGLPCTTSAECTTAQPTGCGGTWSAAPQYHWYTRASQPLYWIYGGAGLEGGPGIMEPGTQFYWCGRCHTTGWTADSSFDITKLPASQFTSIDSNTTAVGGATKLLDSKIANTATTPYATDANITSFSGTSSSWDQWGIECSRCHKATDDGHATWPTVGTAGQSGKTTGGDVTALCLNCHRQENVFNGQRGIPKPLDAGFCSNNATKVCQIDGDCVSPGTCNKKALAVVWTNRVNQPDGFWHHPDGNEFLNSPHAEFSGDWNHIGLSPIQLVGPEGYLANNGVSDPTMANYASLFKSAVVTDLGENTSTAGGCTSCHNVHKSINANSDESPTAEATKACTECHSNTSATVSPQVSLSATHHPTGTGTPIESGAEATEACSICHQPPGIKHIWRVNTDSTYKTYATYNNTSGKTLGGNPSNTTSDGKVWVDMDSACGQCHGGGTGESALPDEREYPVESGSYFDLGTGSGYAPYFTKAQLGAAAKGMHGLTSMATSSDCLTCHSTAQGDAFAITPGTNHATADCTTCHGTSVWAMHQQAAEPECLGCHNGALPAAPNKSASTNGGHANMSRQVTAGTPLGMPGVSGDGTTNNFTGDSSCADGACLDGYGNFLKLWSQEDYPKMPVNWTAGTVTLSYCATGAPGGTFSHDSFGNDVTSQGNGPDTTACPTCETPILGDAGWGYPLNYPDQTTCESAGKCSTVPTYPNHNGLPCTDSASCTTAQPAGCGGTWSNAPQYHWYTRASQPLYWIYGGAGLEGGPGIMEPGTQFYWCGRCHTTGWTADSTLNTSKLPATIGVTSSTTAVGGTTKLVDSKIALSTVNGGTTDANVTSFTGTYSSWDKFGIQCERCHVGDSTNHDAHSWPQIGTAGESGKTTGGDVTALCMNCHRQENVFNGQRGIPKPLDAGFCSNNATKVCRTDSDCTSPGTCGKKNMAVVWTNRVNQPDGFWHHPDGDEFLNSPHAKFTGTWNQMGRSPIVIVDPGGYQNNAGVSDPTMANYQSSFRNAVVADLGQNTSTAGGCTSCHDNHTPHNENIAGMGGNSAMKAVCTDCHSNGSATVSPQINMATVNHLSGTGTPIEPGAEATEACSICHQPPGIKHIWRINTSASYKTYAAYNNTSGKTLGGNPSNTAPDADSRDAVWVDLDSACGQCHGGGTNDTTGLPDEREYPRESASYFELGTGAGYAPYFTKAQLGAAAAGIHSQLTGDCASCHAQVSYHATTNTATVKTPAAFDTNGCKTCHVNVPNSSTTQTVHAGAAFNVQGACGYCHGGSNGSGATHNGAPYHTLAELTNWAGQIHQGVIDLPPTISLGTCSVDSCTGLATMSYTVTDGTDLRNLDVTWGTSPASSLTFPGASDTTATGNVTHTYSTNGTFNVTGTVYDSIGQSAVATATCTRVAPSNYSIAVTVKNHAGTLNAATAKVVLKYSNGTTRTGYTGTNGQYTFGNVPDCTSYTITVTKAGWTFTIPAASGTISGANASHLINALTP